MRVAAVNCEQQQALCQQYGIRGYPTIRAFRCAPPGWLHSRLGELRQAHCSQACPDICPAPICLAPCSGGRLHEYQGDRSARHLKDWALSLLPKHVKPVNKVRLLFRMASQLADSLERRHPSLVLLPTNSA